MKKLLACILTLILSLCCLTACDSDTPIFHVHTLGDWECNEDQHWQPVYCVWGCNVNVVSYDHFDENKDGICEICGYSIRQEGYQFEYIATEDGHCEHMVGTSCEGTCVKSPHEDGDADMRCDVCGYQITPTNHFLRDRAGLEWLNEVTAEDIAEIKIISEAVGVAPGAFRNISTAIAEDVIARIFEDYYWLDTSPISKEDAEIDGGGAVTVKFILKDGTVRELYINNGNYRDANGNCFELLYIPRFNDGEYVSSHGFITYRGIGTLYSADDTATPICEFQTDELEFAKLTDDIVLDEKPTVYYVETEFGKLYFLSERYFYIEGIVGGDIFSGEINPIYYQLVGKSLYELINKEYSLTINDKDWLYEDLPSTYKAGDTVTVKIKMATDIGYSFLVNGEEIASCKDVDGLYWEFTFTMPACDAVIDFKTYDGFLPD